MSLDLQNQMFVVITADELTRNILRRTGHNPSTCEQLAKDHAKQAGKKSSYLIVKFSQYYPYRKGFAVFFFDETSEGWGCVMITKPENEKQLITLSSVLLKVIFDEQKAKQTPKN